MRAVDIDEAETELSRLVDEAVHGELFIIAKAGKPLVEVTAIEPPTAKRPMKRRGFLAGQITVPDDFDTMCQKEIEDMFYGGE